MRHSLVREETYSTPSGTFRALRAGAGETLIVVLHGFPDHPPSFVSLIERLAEAGYDVVAPWLRGYAPSTLEGPYHIDRVADDALELASALGHEHFAVVGHDWGALATYAACARAPERITAAVVLSIPHPRAFLRANQLLRSAYIALLAGVNGPSIGRAFDFAFIDLLWRIWSPGLRRSDSERQALHACLERSWPAPALYYRALFVPPGESARRYRTLKIKVPTLHLHGRDDGCVLASTGRGQASYFRGPFRSEIIDGAGHFLPIEAPELVARHALEWIHEFG